MSAAVLPIEGVARAWAWGSTTAIPALLGQPPTGDPIAELWFGAHPDDPSPVDGTTLDKLVEAEPDALLGTDVASRFDGRLPFLLKLLAAETALSIQVHPTLAQARAGFAAEDDRGIPRDAANRNYRDTNHKPELIFALTEFDALCGFRPVADTLRLLDALDVPQLASCRDLLAGRDGLRAAFRALLEPADPVELVGAVVAALPRLAGGEWAALAAALSRVAADFPGDVGVVVALLLNYVRLQPGEAIYLGAGNVHAYLHGLGVEIMANSDNVLRCGLTGKHIDVPELLAITDFAPLAEPRWAASEEGVASWGFDTPAADFHLATIDLDGFKGSCAVGRQGPHVVLCTAGQARVTALGDTVELAPGRAAFVAAREAAFTIAGTGTVFTATTGELRG